MASNGTNTKMFSLRDVIWLGSLILTFSASFFPMKAKVNRNSATLEKYNLELIQYKQDEIKEDFKEFKDKFDGFADSFNDYINKERR